MHRCISNLFFFSMHFLFVLSTVDGGMTAPIVFFFFTLFRARRLAQHNIDVSADVLWTALFIFSVKLRIINQMTTKVPTKNCIFIFVCDVRAQLHSADRQHADFTPDAYCCIHMPLMRMSLFFPFQQTRHALSNMRQNFCIYLRKSAFGCRQQSVASAFALWSHTIECLLFIRQKYTTFSAKIC